MWHGTRDAIFAGKSPLTWSWSWPAFLFGFVWWAYRKQWWAAALLLTVPVAVGYVLPTAGKGLAGVGIAVAILAPSTYVQLAVAQIAKIRTGSGGTAEIAAAGGVSRPAAIVGGVVLGLIVAAYIAALTAMIVL